MAAHSSAQKGTLLRLLQLSTATSTAQNCAEHPGFADLNDNPTGFFFFACFLLTARHQFLLASFCLLEPAGTSQNKRSYGSVHNENQVSILPSTCHKIQNLMYLAQHLVSINPLYFVVSFQFDHGLRWMLLDT